MKRERASDVTNDGRLEKWCQLIVIVFGAKKGASFTTADVKSQMPDIPNASESLKCLLAAGYIEHLGGSGDAAGWRLLKTFSNPRGEQLRVQAGVALMGDGEWYDEDSFRRGLSYQDGRKVVSEMKKAGYAIDKQSGDRNIISYRMPSTIPQGDVKHGTGIPASRKKQLFTRDSHTCVFCGGEFSHHELFPDHKLPVNTAGDTVNFASDSWMDGFQTVCRACNYNKREACKKCGNITKPEQCRDCWWFDPKGKPYILVPISRSTTRILGKIARKQKVSVNEVAGEMIRRSCEEG